jgi:2-polyprenyl-3-methyl-5-hydroxy-6-metoxy-1,4-benzoquinol methylase
MDRRFEAPELFDVIDHAERYNRHLLEHVLAFAGPARTVLDFGAGTGRLATALAARGLEVTGVEPDSRLRARLAQSGIANVARLDELRDRRFDYAVSLNVLEHCPDDAGVVRAIHERLAPGGRCLFYVPAFPLLWTTNDVRVGHQRRYRRGSLVRLFRAAGFATADARYVDSLGFFAALAYRGLGRTDGELTARSVRLYDRLLFPTSRQLDRLLYPLLGKNLLLRAQRG